MRIAIGGCAWVLFGLFPGLLAAQVAVPTAPPSAAREVHGRVEQHGDLRLLHVWGTPAERGYAHGFLLADDIAAVAVAEFTARFARHQPLLQQARTAVDRLIEYPKDVRQELDALYQALLDRHVDLQMPELERAFDEQDLLVANALDVFGLMGCSGFTVWGDQVMGGGVLTARNFDWPFTGVHMLDHTIVLVEHLADGHAVAVVTWPGYVGCVTGISNDGVAAFLHVGTGKITFAPEPSSWPTATAARDILEHGTTGGAAAVFAHALEVLGNTSPPAGYLTRVVLPAVPASGPPVAVFETDAHKSIERLPQAGSCVVTNHFRERTDGRGASKDSLDREQRLTKGLADCVATNDHEVDVDEAWQLLRSVQRGGGHAFGTLHSLVFRFEPWCFELRLAVHQPKGLVAAPDSDRRYTLTRDELFTLPR